MRVDRSSFPSSTPSRAARAPFIVALLALLSLSACAVTHDDIETWTGTVRGPGKILAVLTKWSKFPAMIEIPKLTIGGKAAIQWTIGFEGSLIMVAAGALMGLRTTISMVVAAVANYAVLAPWIMSKGGITKLGYRGIVSWSLWPGAAL